MINKPYKKKKKTKAEKAKELKAKTARREKQLRKLTKQKKQVQVALKAPVPDPKPTVVHEVDQEAQCVGIPGLFQPQQCDIDEILENNEALREHLRENVENYN